jgi:uncharacterized protein (DUF1501 family)
VLTAVDALPLTRRAVLQGTGLSLLSLALPELLGATPAPDGRTLVVIQLAGGNDGLNTVVPIGQPEYRKLRPTVGLTAEEVLSLERDGLAFHASLKRLHERWQRGQLAAVLGVGLPKPNRSHFEATAVWQSARTDAQPEATGWLGRPLESRNDALRQPLVALGIGGGGISPVLYARGSPFTSLMSLDAFTVQPDRRYPNDAPALNAGLAGLHQEMSKDSAELALLRRVGRTALASSAALADAVKGYRSTAEYPKGPFGDALRLVGQLMAASLGVRVFHVTLGGFDTHANQRRQQAPLLQQLSEGVCALLDDAAEHGTESRLVVMTYSEFGRRAQENASGGTDHGAGSVAFVVGERVAGGLHGQIPRLDGLVDGDVPSTVDFRSLYSSILRDWLAVPPAPVVGQVPVLGLIRSTA